MTSVAQSLFAASGNGTYTGTFSAAPAAGNSVILLVTGVNSSAISSSSPLWGGSAVSGAVKLFEVFANNMYSAGWLLPAVGDGSTKTFSLTVTNGQANNNVGTLMLDVAGLGATPGLDSTATPDNTGSGSSTSVSSGSTSAVNGASDIIVGCGAGFSISLTGPGGWTNTSATSPGSVFGYQIPGASGGSYTYNPTASPSGGWSAGVAAVAATGGTAHTATVSMTVTPLFAVIPASHIQKATAVSSVVPFAAATPAVTKAATSSPVVS